MLSPTLVRLVAGRAMMIVAGASDPAAAVRYQIDTPVASVRIDGPGEFRVAVLDSRDAETELAVVRGFASLATERGEIAVRAGERTVAFENGTPSSPQTFNSARFDAFDRWVAGRRDARMAASSAQYLPRELQTYGGTLDRYGSWQYTAPYGYVWYPTVAADWRPYYYGNWSPIPIVRLDVDRRRPLVVADASLRPLGSCRRPLVLDSRPHVGTGVGVVGSGARLRELVPARLRRPAGLRAVDRLGQFVGRLDRGASPIVRLPGLPREPPRDSAAPAAAHDAVHRAIGRAGCRAARFRPPVRRCGSQRRARRASRSRIVESRSGARHRRARTRRPGTRNDRAFSAERRRDADSPAATRDFRQPLPDGGRTRAVDRATPGRRSRRVSTDAALPEPQPARTVTRFVAVPDWRPAVVRCRQATRRG